MASGEMKLRISAAFDMDPARASELNVELLFDQVMELLLAEEECEDPAVGGSLVGGQFEVEFVVRGGMRAGLTHAERIAEKILALGEGAAFDWLGLEALRVRELVA